MKCWAKAEIQIKPEKNRKRPHPRVPNFNNESPDWSGSDLIFHREFGADSHEARKRSGTILREMNFEINAQARQVSGVRDSN